MIAQPSRSGASEAPTRWILLASVLVVASGLAVVRVAMTPNFFADEVEHAHLTWALGQGLAPYRDIHQIHMPLVWIAFAPILSALPASIVSLLVLRLLCLAALAGTIAAGLIASRELAPRPSMLQRLLFVSIALSMVVTIQFDRYRPDPFMAVACAWAILAMLRMRRAPALHAFLSGAALGLAAGCSTKMVPLCLMVPLLSLVEAQRLRDWRPLLMGAPNLAGFLTTSLPLLAWLQHRGIFDAFLEWTVVGNADMVRFTPKQLAYFVAPGFELAIFAGLAALGAAVLLRDRQGRSRTPWSPVAGLLIASLLAWSIRVIEPNHYIYNLQAMLMPGALLGAIALERWLRGEPRWLREATLAALLAAALWRPIVTHGIRMDLSGRAIDGGSLAMMIEAVDSPEARCLGFAPWHPVFCRNVTDLYLAWDFAFLLGFEISAEGKAPYRAMWPRAIEDIRERRPVLVVDANFWRSAHRRGILSDPQIEEFEQLMQREYRATTFGSVSAWVRRDD